MFASVLGESIVMSVKDPLCGFLLNPEKTDCKTVFFQLINIFLTANIVCTILFTAVNWRGIFVPSEVKVAKDSRNHLKEYY